MLTSVDISAPQYIYIITSNLHKIVVDSLLVVLYKIWYIFWQHLHGLDQMQRLSMNQGYAYSFCKILYDGCKKAWQRFGIMGSVTDDFVFHAVCPFSPPVHSSSAQVCYILTASTRCTWPVREVLKSLLISRGLWSGDCWSRSLSVWDFVLLLCFSWASCSTVWSQKRNCILKCIYI